MSNHNKIKSFYDTVYYQNASSNVVVTGHLRRLAKKIGISQGQQILDVACGTGGWLLAAKEMGGSPNGVDLSSKAIEICKKNMPEGTFYSSPAESLPFENEQFDVVTCLGSLEHFLDPVAALKEMVRVSKKHAKFILLVAQRRILNPSHGPLPRHLSNSGQGRSQDTG